ncbi:MAG: Flp family type IVb pilin [Pseudomonadota bacterium]
MLNIINYYFNRIKASLNNEEGQGMVEYALIIGLVAIVLIVGLNALQLDISAVFTKIGDGMNPPAAAQ